MNKLTIDWIRHAESCSNLLSEYYNDEDNYPNRTVGYDILTDSDKKFFVEQKRTLDPKTLMETQFKYHPNLSYIGMQHAILLGSEFICPNIDSIYVVFASATIRTIMTAMLAFRRTSKIIYVVPFINEKINYYEGLGPDHQNTPFTSDILKQQIRIIKNWMETNWISKYDDIEIMTNLIQLKKLIENDFNSQNIVSLIVHALTCKINHPNREHDISEIIYLICSNCNYNTPLINPIIDFLKSTQKFSFLRGPIVDFSILEHFERICDAKEKNNHRYFLHQFLREPIINSFYDQVLPYAFTNKILSPNSKICCFTHSEFMKFIFKFKESILNTQVFEEILEYQLSDSFIYQRISISYDKYIPKKVRGYYQNFEKLNSNPCLIHDVFGHINYPQISCLSKEIFS